MSRVVVAGGAGFLGSHLCAALVARGDDVIAVDDLTTSLRENLRPLENLPGFQFVLHDVNEALVMEGAVDVVFNLACPASPTDFGPLALKILETGSTGTRRLLDLALDKGARYFQASTSEVYGDPLVHPQPETYWGNVNPIGPRSVYDEAKRFGEALTMAYHREHGLDVRIARIFNTYGPHMRADDGRVVSTLVCQALQGEPLTVFGSGTQTRSFTYVSDEVAGFLLLADSDYVGPVNLGDPSELTVLDLADMVLRLTGSGSRIEHVPLPTDDPVQRRPDVSLAQAVLGWTPEVDLEEGLARTIDWFRFSLQAATGRAVS